MPGEETIFIGVSACLLGENVRYDGGHRLSRTVRDLLSGRLRPLPVCPEVETGMPVPREKVNLFGPARGPRMIGLETREDWTSRMIQYAGERIRRRDIAAACGFILKSRSPSCGLGDARLIDPSGRAGSNSDGLFARALRNSFPDLPLIDETRLEDPASRELFVRQVERYWASRKSR